MVKVCFRTLNKPLDDSGLPILVLTRFPGIYARSHTVGHRVLGARMLTSGFSPRHLFRSLILYRTNSKATVRVALKDILPLTPPIIHVPLTKSQYYATKSAALVFQADSSRKQRDNVDECFHKLHQLILQIGRSAIIKETSHAQVEKIKKLYVLLVNENDILNCLADRILKGRRLKMNLG